MRSTDDTVLAGVRRAGELVLLVLVVGAALACVVVPRLAGAEPYTVATGSMAPVMPPGTLVVVRPVDPADVGLGDVITFMPRPDDPSVVTHRVVGQGFDVTGAMTFRTKGDANDRADPWVVRDRQLVGKRWYFVPYLGYVTDLLSTRQRTTVIYVASALMMGYALVMFAGAFRDRVRRPRASHAHG